MSNQDLKEKLLKSKAKHEAKIADEQRLLESINSRLEQVEIALFWDANPDLRINCGDKLITTQAFCDYRRRVNICKMNTRVGIEAEVTQIEWDSERKSPLIHVGIDGWVVGVKFDLIPMMREAWLAQQLA